MVLSDPLVRVIFTAVRSAVRGAEKSIAPLTSVILGIIAVLLTALLALIVSALVVPLLFVDPGGHGGANATGGMFALVFLLIPVAFLLSLAAAVGIVLATVSLLSKRRPRFLPLAVLGLLLNVGALLAAAFNLVRP